MDTKDKHHIKSSLVIEQRQEKLFHIFNTTLSFVEDICFYHLGDRVNCSCKDKKRLGRVKELTEVYEKKTVIMETQKTETLYNLNPTVSERIKIYEKQIR